MFDGRIIEANQAFLDMVGYAREDLVSGRLRWTELTPAEWRDADDQALAELKVVGTLQPREKEYFRKDGSRVPVLVARALFEGKADEGVAFVIDMTERKRAEEKLRASEQRLLEAQMELAHANRVTTMGQLTASIAHEVKQPIGATVTNAQAALRFLGAEVVDTNELQEILRDIVKDGNRAGEVISRISDLIKKAPPRRDNLEINGAIREVIEFTRGATVKNRVSVRTELADRLPLVRGDRVELQQVILNLVMNGIEAMQSVEDRPRELVIRSGSGRDTTGERQRDGLRHRYLCRERGPAVQRLLHHQIQRHGYGALDLPFDHRSPQWPAVGHGKRYPTVPRFSSPCR